MSFSVGIAGARRRRGVDGRGVGFVFFVVGIVTFVCWTVSACTLYKSHANTARVATRFY